ncbi:hypothetical protein TrRE_jg513, partial [Triparma retinervis]
MLLGGVKIEGEKRVGEYGVVKGRKPRGGLVRDEPTKINVRGKEAQTVKVKLAEFGLDDIDLGEDSDDYADLLGA